MDNHPLSIHTNQTGGSTLIMAGVLLFSTTLITLYGAQVGVLEQRVTNNFYRAKQAAMASDAGLNKTIVAIKRSNVTTDSGILDNMALSEVGTYDIAYQTLTSGNPDKLLVSVTGHSLDDSSTSKVSQKFEFSPFLRSTVPAVTLTSFANITLTNNINIDNKNGANDTLIWTGGTLSKSDDVHCPRSPSQTSTTIQKERIVTLSTELTLNADGSTKNGNAYFETFFTNTKENIKKVSTVVDCTTSGCTNSDIEGLTGLVWVEGDVEMSYAKNTGIYTQDAAGTVTAIAPVVLIVTGDFKMSNINAQVNGLVYLMGDWLNNNGNAKGKIKGSVIVEGQTILTGTTTTAEFLELKYNQTIIDYLKANSGVYLPVPGSWRNFENS